MPVFPYVRGMLLACALCGLLNGCDGGSGSNASSSPGNNASSSSGSNASGGSGDNVSINPGGATSDTSSSNPGPQVPGAAANPALIGAGGASEPVQIVAMPASGACVASGASASQPPLLNTQLNCAP